jgi:hypothetical protein
LHSGLLPLVSAALYFFWETQEVKTSVNKRRLMKLCLFIRQFCRKNPKNYAISKLFAQKTMHINYEFKARCDNIEAIESKLKELSPLFIGLDNQVDTYFNVTVVA